MKLITDMARALGEYEYSILDEGETREKAIESDMLYFTNLVRAALAEAERRGYVLVPKEPTEAMVPRYVERYAYRRAVAARPAIEGEDK